MSNPARPRACASSPTSWAPSISTATCSAAADTRRWPAASWSRLPPQSEETVVIRPIVWWRVRSLNERVVAAVLGGAALLRWQRGGRRILAVLFALGFVIGALGIWFHSGGHPLTHVLQVLSAWQVPPGQNGGIKIGTQPPTFAPAAFWGLGSIGLIACITRTAGEREPAAPAAAGRGGTGTQQSITDRE